jgi:hypothetical protein
VAGIDQRFAEILLPEFPVHPEEIGRNSNRKFGKQPSTYILTHFTDTAI